ncbi:MAG: ABC transporter substrate-binding protein, partial [Polyangiaceae bacterium]|nr:ABC transporter substrate-binding protein [Polyangiaceae bacterium]
MLGRRQFIGGAAGLGAVGFFGFNAGCGGGGSATEWVVGSYLSLTGGEAKFGADTKDGIELAVEEINAAGGVKGKKIKVLFEDNKGQVSEVTNKVQQLIDRDKVVALLGEVASSRSEPAAVIASKKGIPMISPSSTNKVVTEGKDFAFRVCFVDEFQGKMGAEFCVKTLGKKKIGIAFAEDDLYSNGLAGEFRKAVKELGGEIVGEAKFTQNEMNFTTFAKELKASGAEMIYAPIYYKQMVQLGRHAKEEGITGNMWLGSDGWSGEQALLDELEGAYFTDHHAPDLPWEPSKKFVAAYEAKFKRKPSSLAAMGYDAAGVLADAIKRAKEDTPKGIRDAIAETKDFPGASGVITIGPDRNAQKPIVVSQIRGKEAHYADVRGPGAEKLLGGATPPAAAQLTAEPSATASA